MKKTLLTLLFSVSAATALAQASCGSAVNILLGSTTTAPAFTDENGAVPTNFCGLGNGNPTATKGKWYSYTALANNNLVVSSVLPQNNNTDTRVIVYSGTCAGLVCVGANDDLGNGTLGSYLSFAATTGTTYFIAFDNRYSQSGFDFTLSVAPPPAPDRLSFTSQTVAGITGGYNNCIVDMNGDYKDDIVSAIDNTHFAVSYQQTGGAFSTTTFTVANTTVQPSWSIAAGDYDNNGYNDLVYGSGSGITLLKANADGSAYATFRKPQSYLTQRTNFVDINDDGKLDVFVCDDNSPNRYYYNDGAGNILEQNQGGLGTFPTGGNYASLWFDYDNDGDIDMHMSKCGQGGSGVGGNIDEMYRNNGDGTYTNVASAAGLAAPEQSWSSAIGDFNNDGWMDIILGVNSTSDGNTKVLRNNTDGTFTSVTAGSGYDTVFSTGREYVTQDFDNDGFLDVLGSGNTIMFGDGNFHFVANPNTYPLSTVDRPIGDLNNDGFLDIQNGTSVLFNNGNTNKWLNINLQGNLSNRNGIGARIEIYGPWGRQIRDVQSGTGFQNMSTLTAHFGLGTATQIDQIIVKWPSGVIDALNNVNANQNLLIVEASSPLGTADFTSSDFSLYPVPAKSLLNIKTNSNLTFTKAQLFDIAGRIVLDAPVSNNSINVESLTSGTYILLLTDQNSKEYSQKFIKE